MKDKDIKDYLHFYIGCECVTLIDDDFVEVGILKGVTESEVTPSKMIAITGNGFDEWFVEDIKPILRPLSSMTEEEKREYRKSIHGISTDNILPEISAGRLIKEHHSLKSAECTRWLLSKHFDVYNLIESNLAVASNK